MATSLAAVTVPWRPLGVLVLASAAIMGSPGPATVSLVAAGSAYGGRRSAPYLLGIIGGTAFVLAAVGCGITAALFAMPALKTALVVVSALYILWLAYHLATAPPLADNAGADPPSFAGGLLLGVANPKAWVAIAAVFASSRLSDAAAADAIAKAATLTVMIVLINSAWLLAGASLAPLLRDPSRSRTVNIALAVVLVAASASAIVH